MPTANVTINKLQRVIFTLQYCPETFEGACQCGRCDPCTAGKDDIREAISIVEEFQAMRVEQT